MFTRNAFKLFILIAAAVACPSSFAAYPDRPISMIVPFAPGGNLDITARAIAPTLQKILGVSVVVENKPGAGGAIGAGLVSRSAPDGYTILVSTPNAIAVVPYMTKTSYTLSSFRAVGGVASTPLLLDINAGSKLQTIQALMQFACANPGKLTVGISGIGTTNHLGLIRLQEASHCTFTTVPYKGSGPALVDLLGNQIDMVVDQLSSSATQLKSGKLKALAVMTAHRAPTLPDVPTLEESGVKGLDMSTVTGLLVPVNTPTSVVDVLNKALQKAAVDVAVQRILNTVGSTAKASTPEDFMTLIKNEDVTAGKLNAEGKLRTN